MITRKGNLRKIVSFWLLPFFIGGCLSSGYLFTQKAILMMNRGNRKAIQKSYTKHDSKSAPTLDSQSSQILEILKKSEVSIKDQSTSQEQNTNANEIELKIDRPTYNKEGTGSRNPSSPVSQTSNINASTMKRKSNESFSTQISTAGSSGNPKAIQEKIILSIQQSTTSQTQETIFKKLFQRLPKP